MIENILRSIERIVPKKIYRLGQPMYHYLLAVVAMLIYRFPSRSINIVAITGTKGKSTTTELVNAALEAGGKKTAILSTIRFKIGSETRPNKHKMTVPGRFFVQKFLREAVDAGCEWVVMEMSSEAVKQFRHIGIAFNALIFTNLAPEHIESHGSYEKYRDTKLKLARAVARSSKDAPVIVANTDDTEGEKFLALGGEHSIPYRLADGAPHTTSLEGSTFSWKGFPIALKLPGVFNIMNALGAATFAASQGIEPSAIVAGLESVESVRGRVEYIREGQDFSVVVDYAHTPESLEAFYGVFEDTRKICILGNTGGGRDTWKRPVMAGIAEKHCDEIILTNEDPYDEDPRAIIAEMETGISNKNKLSVIIDRRTAIHEALVRAQKTRTDSPTTDVSVLITGKGTDPYIMTAGNTKIPWDDATVAREELIKLTTDHAA